MLPMVLSLPGAPPPPTLWALLLSIAFQSQHGLELKLGGWGRPDCRGGTSKPDVRRQQAASTPSVSWGTSTEGYNSSLTYQLDSLIFSLTAASNAWVTWSHGLNCLPAVLFLDRRVASCSPGAGLVVAPVPKEDPNGAPALHLTFSGSQMPRGSSLGYGDEAEGLLSLELGGAG